MTREIIYVTAHDSCHTLQRLIDDAVIAKWRREATTIPAISNTLLSGANIQLIHEVTHAQD